MNEAQYKAANQKGGDLPIGLKDIVTESVCLTVRDKERLKNGHVKMNKDKNVGYRLIKLFCSSLFKDLRFRQQQHTSCLYQSFGGSDG